MRGGLGHGGSKLTNSFCVSSPLRDIGAEGEGFKGCWGKVTRPFKERSRERSKHRYHIFHKRVAKTTVILRLWPSCTKHIWLWGWVNGNVQRATALKVARRDWPHTFSWRRGLLWENAECPGTEIQDPQYCWLLCLQHSGHHHGVGVASFPLSELGVLIQR